MQVFLKRGATTAKSDVVKAHAPAAKTENRKPAAGEERSVGVDVPKGKKEKQVLKIIQSSSALHRLSGVPA